jgi:DNA-directed RNA polymerase specialized sigma24 family protein
MKPTERQVVTFDDFVRARLPHLLRFGRALTGDEHRGADLVQDALERALPKWSRIEEPEVYVRRTMVNRNVSVWRDVRRERLTDTTPDRIHLDVERDDALFAALRRLPVRQAR